MENQTFSYDEAYNASLDYFKGDELAARVWVNKYAVKDSFGNIYEKGLREMMTSDRQVRFGIEKRNSLPYRCVRCKYYFACHGECPKHRFNRTESGETGLNALCDGYFMFYSHVSPYMDKMKELLMAGQAPAGVIPWARMRAMKHI